jgi:hypothetical protein
MEKVYSLSFYIPLILFFMLLTARRIKPGHEVRERKIKFILGLCIALSFLEILLTVYIYYKLQ